MPVAGSTAVQEPSIGFSCAVALLAPAAAATTQARPPTRRTAAERGLLMAVSPSGKAGARRGSCRGNERHERRERSEEHTSELQSLMRHSYAVFCLKKKNKDNQHND